FAVGRPPWGRGVPVAVGDLPHLASLAALHRHHIEVRVPLDQPFAIALVGQTSKDLGMIARLLVRLLLLFVLGPRPRRAQERAPLFAGRLLRAPVIGVPFIVSFVVTPGLRYSLRFLLCRQPLIRLVVYCRRKDYQESVRRPRELTRAPFCARQLGRFAT